MDRISGANYGTDGSGHRIFIDLDLATNTPGTSVEAIWLNGVQASILKPVEDAGITPSDADNTQLLTALRQLIGKNRQVFTASGSFTVPATVTKVKVTVLGGGAGGGGSTSTSGSAGGGGAGGLSSGFYAVTPGNVIPVTIGVGGTGGAGGSNGGSGGTSSFGALCSATGGIGGVGTTIAGATVGGGGGTGTGGTLNVPGWPGLNASTFFGGTGASSWFGAGGLETGGAGGNAQGYGAGGAGGAGVNVGGAGVGGLVIVEW